MPRVSLKPVGQQIRAIQRQLRSSRGKAAGEQRSEIDALIAKLDGLHDQAVDCCPKGMDGLAVAYVKKAAAKAKPAAKAKAKRRR